MADPRRKVRTREEVLALIGQRPRKKKVILLAGVFDVVHPGHIRHLMYAKSKAPIVIAGVVSDRHVDKGVYRPHVTQDLRALNLAALEVVDHVFVYDEPTTIDSILALQPDLFGKGYEYQEKPNPRTKEEHDAVTSYGGEMIFTPGDVVYSSTRLLERPPTLGHEKLLEAMHRDGTTFSSVARRLASCRGARVQVVGDLIVDVVARASPIGASSKTPTLSVLMEGRDRFVGGAGVVAKHLRSAGADVSLSTVVGDDEDGRWAFEDLEAAGVRPTKWIEPTRPTTRKEVVLCAGHRLLKMDTVDNRTISDEALAGLAYQLNAPSDLAVLSDFRHGVFNRRTIPVLCGAIRSGFRAADSQVASRWGNVTDFRGFDLVTPNEREARFALGDQDTGIRPLAHDLLRQAEAKRLILKLGARGLVACEGPSFLALDSFAREVVDPVGAGDALLAYASLALASGGSLVEASILGGIAAGLACERDGNVPVSASEVASRVADLERACRYEVAA